MALLNEPARFKFRYSHEKAGALRLVVIPRETASQRGRKVVRALATEKTFFRRKLVFCVKLPH